MTRDDIDDKILSILQSNSRTTNVELAKSVGLTEGAVRNRIDHLVKNGTIKQFTIETSSGSFFGVVMVKAKQETKKMMADIVGAKLTKDAYEISGDFDGCVILEGTSLEEIDGKIDEIRRLPSVQDTKTFISLRRW